MAHQTYQGFQANCLKPFFCLCCTLAALKIGLKKQKTFPNNHNSSLSLILFFQKITPSGPDSILGIFHKKLWRAPVTIDKDLPDKLDNVLTPAMPTFPPLPYLTTIRGILFLSIGFDQLGKGIDQLEQ
ncbi:MAG: hypothetical protein HGA96_13645 [Desulfobulbaceae bacterium]|nr:hypothetical protein [Desulfobulbaceae bacterium]